jgi:hypothetical protein
LGGENETEPERQFPREPVTVATKFKHPIKAKRGAFPSASKNILAGNNPTTHDPK